jgi:hypothetical protein
MRGLEQGRRCRAGAVLGLILALAAPAAAGADAARWSVEAEPVFVEIRGHDPHVVTARRPGATEAVELDTDSALGYRAAVRRDQGRWGLGLDFFIHRTAQSAGPLTEAAGGPADARSFELPHRSFVSNGPDEVLYYRSLEDTTVELWVLDLTARRVLGAEGEGPWALVFGLRNADFDNDYRAVAGLGDVGGTRIDASSNYSRMMGPLAGVVYAAERGRHSFEADLRLALVFGDIELSRTLRDFEGPPGPFAGPPEELPPGTNQQRLATTDSIEVPMSGLRFAWRYRPAERWTLGAGLEATAWSGLAVPPGVVPERPDRREETTLVTYGGGVTVGYHF